MSSSKKEGDFTTPKGKFKFLNLFFRKDKIKVKTKLKKIIIKKNMGWCDDISSKFYNRLIKLPFRYKYEKLFRSDNIYDIFIVINYNTKPIRKKKGSAIFLHVAKKNYKATKGCLAVSKKDMRLLLNYIDKKTQLII